MRTWKLLLHVFLQGLKDAVSLHKTILFYYDSRVIRLRTFQCLALNGALFLGSIVIMNKGILPLMQALSGYIDQIRPGSISELSETFVEFLVSTFYHVFWLYPIYIISLILNAVWFQNIAEQSYLLFTGKESASIPVMEVLRDEIYRIVLMGVLVIEIAMMNFIPIIGFPLAFIHTCWMYSFYALEYRWNQMGWDLNQRLRVFEEHWLYMIGFGFPISVATFFFPLFVGSGLLAVILPILIVLGVVCKPIKIEDPVSQRVLFPRVRMFRIPHWVSFQALRLGHYFSMRGIRKTMKK
eukprot:TRINITY_DN133045_c0_g2_i1.p1 TRINITY_DN133045_c0_g2~~TRINITY_DN133045_c0_g2_i1.p1  ORF type:complete len:296 (+),score=37.41 TRINITY_DN133045_c0_g2_i1:219-1106(+)